MQLYLHESPQIRRHRNVKGGGFKVFVSSTLESLNICNWMIQYGVQHVINHSYWPWRAVCFAGPIYKQKNKQFLESDLQAVRVSSLRKEDGEREDVPFLILLVHLWQWKGTVGPEAWENQASGAKRLSKYQQHPKWYENLKKLSFKYKSKIRPHPSYFMSQQRIPDFIFPLILSMTSQRWSLMPDIPWEIVAFPYQENTCSQIKICWDLATRKCKHFGTFALRK